MQLIGGIGAAVGILVVVLGVLFATWASRYQKVGPEEVLIISGRKRNIKKEDGSEVQVGFRIVRNGGAFVMPVVEKVGRMSLRVIDTEVRTKNAMSKEGVPLEVSGTALFKIASTDEGIANAAERYLGTTTEEIKADVTMVLEGHLRGVCGTLTPEQIYRSRTDFQTQITEQAQADLRQLGVTLDTLTLRDITDSQGYLDALGQQRTEEVKRDARIGVANADREASIAEAQASRDAEVAQAAADAEIAEAQRDLGLKRAQYDGEVNAEKARADQAGPLATAAAQQKVVAEQTTLATAEAGRREAQLLSEVVRPAEADAKKVAINAEAQARKVEIDAGAERKKLEIEAEGRKAAATLDGEGIAAAARAKGLAEAEVTRATGEADGAKAQAVGDAEAEVSKAKLLAEAEGLRSKAEAMDAFNAASMSLQVVTELIHTLPQIFESVVKPLASVDEIRLIDFGTDGHGADGAGSAPIGRLLGITPQALAAVDESTKSVLGMGITELMTLIRTGRADEVAEKLGAVKEKAAAAQGTETKG